MAEAYCNCDCGMVVDMAQTYFNCDCCVEEDMEQTDCNCDCGVGKKIRNRMNGFTKSLQWREKITAMLDCTNPNSPKEWLKVYCIQILFRYRDSNFQDLFSGVS